MIYINQYNKDKQNLEEKTGDVDKKNKKTNKQTKKTDTSGLVTTTLLNTKISEIENKIPGISCLVTATDYKFLSLIDEPCITMYH